MPKTINSVVVTGFVWVNGKFLLQKHVKSGTYSLPMGKVEVGEDYKDAFIRELGEELNAEPINLIELGTTVFEGIFTTTFFCGLKDNFYENAEPKKCEGILEVECGKLYDFGLIVPKDIAGAYSGLSNATVGSIMVLHKVVDHLNKSPMLCVDIDKITDLKPEPLSGIGWCRGHYLSDDIVIGESVTLSEYDSFDKFISSGNLIPLIKSFGGKVVVVDGNTTLPSAICFMFNKVAFRSEGKKIMVIRRERPERVVKLAKDITDVNLIEESEGE